MEDKLAETAPKQPLALTLGAAAVTIAVIIGVLAGPSVATCFNSSDGMGLCLRGKMVGVGILPEPATALVDPGETPATVTPDTALAEPAPDVTAPQPGVDVPENLVAATFGLLRVEPDGSVVITGSGTPGSEVEIYSNGALLGKAEVGSSGDWVLLPDAPIPPGGTEITLVEAGKSGVAEQTFIVAVNEDKISQPLVVASTPGAAREVLQGLALPAQLAAADPAVSPAEPRTVATEPAPMGATASAKEAAPETATATPAQPPASSETPAKLLTAPEAAPAAATQMAVAAVEPAPTTSAMVLDGTLATIDAIEIEGGKTFFAGSGPEGAAMRLYVDDLFIADTTVSDQRWLIEAGDVLNKPSQRIRVDVLQPESTKVASRAEVNFVVDLPVDAVPVAITQIEQPVMPASDSALSQPIEVVPAQQPATASVAPTEATAALAMAATAEPTAAAMPSGADAPALGSTAAGTSTAVASVPTEPTELDTSAETPPATTSDVPTLVATSVSDPDAARFASGKAIIRRGDNLWTIASRVYGEGIKYTTIYQANTGQIRDPDRIYPGQVFDLPESTD